MDRLIAVVEDFHRRGIIGAEERRRHLQACFDAGGEARVVLGLMESFIDWLESRGQPLAAEGMRRVRTELDAVATGARKADALSLAATSRFIGEFAPRELNRLPSPPSAPGADGPLQRTAA